MLTTVEGIYKAGKIDLSEQPEGITEARVLIVFLEPNGQGQAAPAQTIFCGQFEGPLGQMSTEEDFHQAEWHDHNIPEEFR